MWKSVSVSSRCKIPSGVEPGDHVEESALPSHSLSSLIIKPGA